MLVDGVALAATVVGALFRGWSKSGRLGDAFMMPLTVFYAFSGD